MNEKYIFLTFTGAKGTLIGNFQNHNPVFIETVSLMNHLDVGSKFIIYFSLHGRGVVIGFQNRRKELEVRL